MTTLRLLSVLGRSLAAASIFTALLVLGAGSAPAAPGDLDPTFGPSGVGTVTTPIGASADQAFALARQPDGKLVAAGVSRGVNNNDFALVRYNADGTPDSSFGTAAVPDYPPLA
ncbi:MAG: delta-60 repeat domain-containing protein [Actinomycetota bacterium]|nr:delta-60 repeat domain-containing protein [Actinomycetota bacterium]